MIPLLRILLYFVIVSSSVFGRSTVPSTDLTKTSYAHGISYGCSHNLSSPHCWKYCNGNSGDWCYSAMDLSGHYQQDIDCHNSETCQGWCAWNSQRGCVKTCHEEAVVPEPIKSKCRRGMPYWACQSGSGNDAISRLALKAKWISPDIPNENILNNTGNTITFNGNIITSTKESTSVPQSALWYPIEPIQNSLSTFYWTITIRETGAGKIFIGISDLNKLAAGWRVRGLFYGGNLSDGSNLLIANFGPEPKIGDKLSMLVKFFDGRMKMYIILNDQSLGLAYYVPENTLQGIYPVVQFTGKGSVEIEERVSTDAPSLLEPAKPLRIEGTWTLYTLGNNETFGTEATVNITKLHDRVYDRVYRLSIHILNTFVVKLTELSTSNWDGEILDQTDLKGTTEVMEFESLISKHILGATKFVLDIDKSELRLESKDIISTWKQIEPIVGFVNWNPFCDEESVK